MPMPSVLYDKDGEKIWDIKTSRQNFKTRKSANAVEQNLFFGTTKDDLDKFQSLMDVHKFSCTQPLEIRIMGNSDKVREAAHKIFKAYDFPKSDLQVGPKKAYDKNNNNVPIIPTTIAGISKLECDKKDRKQHYCSNTIRVYLYPFKKGKPTCEKIMQ